MTTRIDRRSFGKNVAAVGTLAAMSASARALGANERVRLGFIGVGNRGDQLLDGFLVHKDCEVVAIADVYEPYLEPAKEKAGGKATLYKDYRKLLEHKGLDAVVLNDISDPEIGFDSSDNEVTILTAAGSVDVPRGSKDAVAAVILDQVHELRTRTDERAHT